MSHPASMGIAMREVMRNAAQAGDRDTLYALARSVRYWAERLSLADPGQLDDDWQLVEGPDVVALHAIIRRYHYLLVMPDQPWQWRAATLMLYAAEHPELEEIVANGAAVLGAPWLRSVWDLPWNSMASPVLTRSFSETDYQGFAVVANGEQVAGVHKDGTVSVHDLTTRETKTLRTRHGQGYSFLAASPDGRWIAVLSETRLQFYWPATGRYSGVQLADRGLPWCIAASPDGSRCVVAGMRADFYDENGESVRLRRPVSRFVGDMLFGRVDMTGTTRISLSPLFRSPLAVFAAYLSHVLLGLSLEGSVVVYLAVSVILLGIAIARGRAVVRRRNNLSDLGDRFSSVCFSPDADMLASADIHGHVQLWSTRRGNLLRTFSEEAESLFSAMMFGPCGSWLALIDMNGGLSIWDVLSGQRQVFRAFHRPNTLSPVTPISCTPSGDFLACGFGEFVNLWELARSPADGKLRVVRASTLVLSSKVSAVEFVDGGSLLAVVTQGSGSVRFWDRESLFQEPARSGLYSVHDICFSPDGTWLALAADRGQVFVRRTEGEPRGRLPQDAGDLACVAMAGDGTWFASGGPDGAVRAWEPHGRPLSVFTDDEAPDFGAVDLQITDDGRVVAGCTDHHVRVWNTSRRLPGRFSAGEPGEGHSRGIVADLSRVCVRMVNSGAAFAVGGTDDAVRIFDSSTFRLLGRLASGHARWNADTDDGRVTSLATSPDGRWLAAGRWNGEITCWLQSNPGTHFSFLAQDAFVSAMAFCPDNRLLASVGDKTLRIWDIRRRECLLSVPLQGGVWGCAWSPDGRRIACAGSSGSFLFELRDFDRYLDHVAVRCGQCPDGECRH